MSEKIDKTPEYSRERLIIEKIREFHTAFLDMVPNYSYTIWDPRIAIKEKAGGCMAELLYVAGGLINDKIIKEQDISIGFSKEHGQVQPLGFINRAGKKYAHSTMLITVANGLTLESDFRATRSDEIPRVQVLLPEDMDIDRMYIGSLSDAITKYAEVDNGDVPNIKNLIELHNKDFIQTYGKIEKNQVRFDEEF